MTERARRFAEEHRARLGYINLQIDRFNAYCPVDGMGRARLNVERELATLLSPPAAA